MCVARRKIFVLDTMDIFFKIILNVAILLVQLDLTIASTMLQLQMDGNCK